MRKRITSALVSASLAAAIAVATLPVHASAQTFSTLSQLQQHLENYSPSQSMAAGTHYIEAEGTIESISWTGKNNHYDLILLVDDPKALSPIGSDSPQLRVHFRLHKEEPPFQVGETVTVFGSLNELYSSVMVPCILAKTINGSEDF